MVAGLISKPDSGRRKGFIRANFESGFRTQIWDGFRLFVMSLYVVAAFGGPILRPESGLKIGPDKSPSGSKIRPRNWPGLH